MQETRLSANQIVISVFILALTYGVLIGLQAARAIVSEIPLVGQFLSIPGFESPMFWAMPFFAFFAVFFLSDWVKANSKNRLAFLAFPVVFFIAAVLAYDVALYWYLANIVSLQGQELVLGEIDFAARLANSAFMPFIWGGVFGWIARFAVEKLKI